jgi:uncharacterized protein (TIGR02118 family)
MTVCWFALFRTAGGRVADAELAWLNSFLAATPGLSKGLIFMPSATNDPYLNDGPPPALGLQLYFDDIAAMEAAMAQRGHLQALVGRDALAGDVTQQAMLVRRFPVPDPTFQTPSGEMPCTYLVAYEGRADDLNAWLAYYIASHPPIMARFPGIREIEIYTRIDWCGFLPWRRVDHMQRNKVVFDSSTALTEALNSPVRHEMRADFAKFPPFTGPNTHFPMSTMTVHAG